jgi:hypothetical protein
MCDVDWGAGALLVSFGQCAHSVVLSYLYIYIRLCMRACVCVCGPADFLMQVAELGV